MISPWKRSASFRAASVFPTAVGPTMTTRRAGCISGHRVLKMRHLGRLPVALLLDGNHIDAPVALMLGVLLQVSLGGLQQMAALFGGDGLFREAKSAGGASLDLHKDQHLPFSSDQVNFSIGGAHVLVDQVISPAGQVIAGQILPPAPDSSACTVCHPF